MGNNEPSILTSVVEITKKYVDSKGPNWVRGKINENAIMDGMDEEGRSVRFSMPAFSFKNRTLSGNPVALWFTKDDKEGAQGRPVILHCEFTSVPTISGTTPLLMVEDHVKMVVADSSSPISRDMSVDYTYIRPQSINARCSLTLDEFLFLKAKLSQKNAVKFEWNGVIRWYDISNPDTLAALKAWGLAKDEKTNSVQKAPDFFSKNASGSVFVEVSEDSESAYGGVKKLLCWEYCEISEEHHIWFKDTLENDTFEFLPQEFRIKADALTNAPKMSIDMKVGTPGDITTYRVLVGFDIAPYYHPRAKRDLYRLIDKRTGGKVKYCFLNYGGYDTDSVRFEWAGDATFELLKEFEIKKMEVKSAIKTSPDSSFRIALETSVFGLTRLKEFLSQESLEIGKVYLTVKDGLKSEPIEIPLLVMLDLRELSGMSLDIKPLPGTDKKIAVPYRLQVTNTGSYDIIIGGIEMSLLAEKKGSVRDAEHGLTAICSFPRGLLKVGESGEVEIEHSEAFKLSRKDKFLGVKVRDYWTKLLCEPHTVSLDVGDIQTFLDTYKNVKEVKLWTLKVRACFKWSDFPDISWLMLEFKNDAYGLRCGTRLSKGLSETDVILSDNLLSILSTQKRKGKTFQYHLQVKTSAGESGWSAWQDATPDQVDYFDVTEDMFKPLIP